LKPKKSKKLFLTFACDSAIDDVIEGSLPIWKRSINHEHHHAHSRINARKLPT